MSWGPRPGDHLSGPGRNRCQWTSWLLIDVGLSVAGVAFVAHALTSSWLAWWVLVLATLAALPGALAVSHLGDVLERRRRRSFPCGTDAVGGSL